MQAAHSARSDVKLTFVALPRGASFESERVIRSGASPGGEREILVLVGLPGFVVFRFDARDPGERLVQVCHVRAGASGELCSAWRGQGFESVLYGVDAPDELRGVRRGDDPFDLLAFAGQDESRVSVQ